MLMDGGHVLSKMLTNGHSRATRTSQQHNPAQHEEPRVILTLVYLPRHLLVTDRGMQLAEVSQLIKE
jgi:hypothetical protein